MTRHAAALLFSALLAGVMSSGCSNLLSEEAALQEEVRTPPPLLEFVSPLDEQVLSSADDVDAQTPGIQTDVMVRVRDLEHDLALHDIEIEVAGDYHRVSLIEHAGGRFAGLEAVTLSSVQGRQRVVLRARVALEDEPSPRALIGINAVINNQAEQPCSRHLTMSGDLDVTSADELPTREVCLTIQGDLILTGTELQSLEGLDAVIEVNGSVVVEGNPWLHDLDGWTSIDRVGGDLVVIDNPALSSEQVARLVDRIGPDDIGGDVIMDTASD